MFAWEEHDTVALDSQGVIQRIWNLQFAPPRPWIEEDLKVQMQQRPRTLMWVKGHQGQERNEEAGKRARMEVELGWRLQKTEIATLAEIKQEHPLHPRAPAHLRWSLTAIKGLVCMVTDKGPNGSGYTRLGSRKSPVV